MRIDRDAILKLLKDAGDSGATDIYFKVPGRPCLRVGGRLVPTTYPRLIPEDTHRAAGLLMGLAELEVPFRNLQEYEFALGLTGLGRFRVHLYRQRGSIAIAIHRVAVDPPDLARIGVPSAWARFAGAPGLTLVSGIRRRELQAALIHHLNQNVLAHVLVIEEQQEFLHRDEKAMISQREVGIDTADWSTGVSSALRQNPDLLVLSDVPDPSTAHLALKGAENGVSVLVGIAAQSAAQAVNRFTALCGMVEATDAHRRLGLHLTASLCLNPSGLELVEADDTVRASLLSGHALAVQSPPNGRMVGLA